MNRIFHRRRKGGFTLIELLVVVLILAILMAVALPLYLSAVADSERKTCRSNMQTIANAVQASRVKNRLSDYTTLEGVVGSAAVTVGSGGELADLQAAPKCPSDVTNEYTIASAGSGNGFTVSCENTDHGTFAPGVNNS